MRIRSLAIPAGLLIVVASAANPQTPAAHPDLSGVYDIATLTPLMRRQIRAARRSLTDAEAAAMAGMAAARKAKLDQASDPNRTAPPAGGDGSEGAAGNVGGYNSLWTDNGTGAFKIDGKFRTSIIVDPPNGRMPQMTPAAAKRAMERGKLNRPNRGDSWGIKEGITPGPS